jgi:hypothetical protein
MLDSLDTHLDSQYGPHWSICKHHSDSSTWSVASMLQLRHFAFPRFVTPKAAEVDYIDLVVP